MHVQEAWRCRCRCNSECDRMASIHNGTRWPTNQPDFLTKEAFQTPELASETGSKTSAGTMVSSAGKLPQLPSIIPKQSHYQKLPVKMRHCKQQISGREAEPLRPSRPMKCDRGTGRCNRSHVLKRPMGTRRVVVVVEALKLPRGRLEVGPPTTSHMITPTAAVKERNFVSRSRPIKGDTPSPVRWVESESQKHGPRPSMH